MSNNTYLYTSGVTFKKPASSKSQGKISDIDVGMSFDDNGNIIFRDNYVANYLKKDSVSLAELYSRTKAITYKDGKIYFKDASLQREYSLEEIVNTCAQWKRNLIAGSLWWVGRHELDHRSCANIPKTKNPSDKLPVYWSVDKFMADTTGVTICDNIKPLSFYEKTTDSTTGKWKWYDVQNLEIVVPPIEDTYKLAMIVAKLSFSISRSQEPIVFRLFDATAGVELTRASVINNSSDYIQTPIPLVYVGQIPMAKFTTTNLAKSTPENIVCDTAEDCGCTDTTCVEGEQNCITPNISYVDNKYSPNSHLIKVQFHVVDFHGDYWDRYFGTEIDNNAASISSINAMIFDASPATTYVHRQGTATFNNTTSVDIVFDKELTTNKYSISLCANKNIQIWYTNKTSKGFTINSELAFQGFVDWTLLNISDK